MVVVLDADHARRVERLWEELECRFGLRGVQRVPLPHLTLHNARSYAAGAVAGVLDRVAARHRPFRARVSGYGVFTGKEHSGLVLFLPVVRGPHLARLHADLCGALAGIADEPNGYYETEHWAPHVTVADRDLDPDRLAEVLRWLAARPATRWTLPVDHLALVRPDPGGPVVTHRATLGGIVPG